MSTNTTTLVRVPFHGDEIEAVQHDDGIWVSVHRICEALGVQLNGQLVKLQRKAWATIKMILMVAPDGRNRELSCLSLDSLPMWLATIDIGRCKASLRPKLELYQTECAKILRDHFFGQPKAVVEAEPLRKAFVAKHKRTLGFTDDLRASHEVKMLSMTLIHSAERVVKAKAYDITITLRAYA